MGGRKLTRKRVAQLVVLLLCWLAWYLCAPELKKVDTHIKSALDTFEFFEDTRISKSGIAEDKSSPDVVRVCTWNVRNYSVAGRRINGKYVQALKPDFEKKALREGIRKINADVLLIQEMGDIQFLRELRSDLSREGIDYNYIAVTRYDAPSRLAIMSKIKPSNIMDCCDIKFKFKGDNRYSPRGVLGFTFDTQGVRWHAFSVHLKSAQGGRKSDENFFPFRAAEMKAIDARVFSETKGGKYVIIGGDYNQEPTSALLKKLRKLKLSLVEQRDAQGRSVTYFWAKKNVYFRYDFFLASSEMSKFIKKPASIFDTGFIPSDHRPVFVDLDFLSNSN